MEVLIFIVWILYFIITDFFFLKKKIISQLTYPTFGDLLQPFISLLSMNVILHFFGRYLSISVIFKNLLSTESIDFNQENNQENKVDFFF